LASVDMRDNRFAAALRVEIGVEHADRAGELQLAPLAFLHVDLGLAELGDQPRGGLTLDAVDPGGECGLRHRDRRRGKVRRARDFAPAFAAAGEHQQREERERLHRLRPM